VGRFQHRDVYARKAQQEGLAARSVYKLMEMDQKHHIFRAGQRVLDLGAAPGSWMQYAADKVKASGYVLGIDLQKIEGIGLPAWAEVRVGDVREPGVVPCGESYNIVLSDMAPRTCGVRDVDAARSHDLAATSWEVAKSCLLKGGTFIVKLLEGRETIDFVKEIRDDFASCLRVRPQATRRCSTELFVMGLRFKG
jgi:23S rRNA (uridine2552-2'-O)-methyltransferase